MTVSTKSKTKRPKYRHKFRIDRSRWCNGTQIDEEIETSKLLTEVGNMCCVGFFAESCGVSPNSLRKEGRIADLSVRQQRKIARVSGVTDTMNPIAYQVALTPIYRRNDREVPYSFNNENLLDEYRKSLEKDIADEFATKHVKVTFYGKYRDQE